MPKFDWYEATLTGVDESELLSRLRDKFDLSDIRKGRLLYGYRECVRLVRGEHDICSVMWGLQATPDPHIVFSGSDAVEGSLFIRSIWPDHRVTRVDSALDWFASGSWDELSSIALSVADEYGVSVQHVGDFAKGEKGRTLYLGSKKSPVFVCLYEKGKQPQFLGAGEPDWVRLEVRVRPSSKSKGACATITPPEVFGCARWTQELFKRVTGSSVPRRQIGTIHQLTDDDRSFQALVKQYGPLIARCCLLEGRDQFIRRLMSSIDFRECPF